MKKEIVVTVAGLSLWAGMGIALVVKAQAIPQAPIDKPSPIVHVEPDKIALELTLEQQELETCTRHWEKVDKRIWNIDLTSDVQNYIYNTATRYKVDPELVLAIMEVESMMDASKIGDNGNSVGIMQIQPRWHQARMERLGVNDLLDVKQNALTGIDLLAELFGKYSDVNYVLMCYNAGEGGASRLRSNGIYCTSYCSSVMEAKKRIGELKLNYDSQITISYK